MNTKKHEAITQKQCLDLTATSCFRRLMPQSYVYSEYRMRFNNHASHFQADLLDKMSQDILQNAKVG